MNAIRLPFFALALLLLSSCASYQYNKALTELHGAPVYQAMALLGPPTSREGNTLMWSKSRIVHQGGYYYTSFQTRYEPGPKGRPITRQVPVTNWVPPYTEQLWCETTIIISDNGTIVEHSFDGNDCSKPE